MSEIKLAESGVVFNQQDHTYWLNNQQLDGITGMIHRQLFPDQYKGVSQDKLDKAAERGSFIHEQCELADSIGIEPSEPQAQDYVALCKKEGLKSIANEYIVTNFISHASPIDVVMQDKEGNIIIADIKTTSKIYTDSVSWQLSIYKTWFEQMNPDIKVSKLVVIWLPQKRYGKAKVVEVPQISSEEVEYLIMAEQSGVQYHSSSDVVATSDDTLPVQFADIEAALYDKLTEIKALEEQAEEFRNKLKEAMENVGAVSWKSERLSLSLTKETETTRFDSKKFKEENPDLYEKYLVTSKRKGSLTIKLK